MVNTVFMRVCLLQAASVLLAGIIVLRVARCQKQGAASPASRFGAFGSLNAPGTPPVLRCAGNLGLHIAPNRTEAELRDP